MTQRIRETLSAAGWRLVAIKGKTMPPRDPNDDDDEAKRKKTTPNRTTSDSRRSSEKPDEDEGSIRQ